MKNNKSLGQHWLKNRAILDQVADLAANGFYLPRETKRALEPSARNDAPVKTGGGEGLSREDKNRLPICLEIGPGLGTLTSSLLKRFERVIAVEFDPQLAANLPKSFPGKNLEVIHGDILNTDIPALIAASTQPKVASSEPEPAASVTLTAADSAPSTSPTDYVVVGNIPYYITSPIIRQLINLAPAPRRIVLLMQKEVAERVAADAGSQSLLSLMVQNRAEVSLGPVVRAAEFTPPPKVDSQVLILDPLSAPQIPDAVFPLIRQGFSNPRKKLSANLAGNTFSKPEWEEVLRREGINPNARAEDLSLWDWENLFAARAEVSHTALNALTSPNPE